MARQRRRTSGRRRTAPATSRSHSRSGRSRNQRPRTSPAAAPGRRKGRWSSERFRSRTPHRGAAGSTPSPSCSPLQEGAHVRARVADALAHRRRELVQRPGVAGGDVVARSGHAPPRLDAGRVPGVARGRDPRRPAGDVDLRQGVEVRPKRADSPCLVGTQLRLVRRRAAARRCSTGRRETGSPPASWRGVASRSASRRRRAADYRQPSPASGRAVAARARARAAAWPPASRTEPGAPRPIGRRAGRLLPHSIRRSRRRRCRSRVRVTSAATPVPPSPREPPERRVAALFRARWLLSVTLSVR